MLYFRLVIGIFAMLVIANVSEGGWLKQKKEPASLKIHAIKLLKSLTETNHGSHDDGNGWDSRNKILKVKLLHVLVILSHVLDEGIQFEDVIDYSKPHLIKLILRGLEEFCHLLEMKIQEANVDDIHEIDNQPHIGYAELPHIDFADHDGEYPGR